MQLFQKKNFFFQIVSGIWKSRLNFENFFKKMPIRADAFPKLRTPKHMVI